jgi:CheY-like chemotaxis protein
MLLRHAGHDVEYAINGYAAINIAKIFRPEVVFLDIGLPGMNGYDVCRLLKGEPGQKALIVAVTGYGTKDDRQRAMAAGCHMHITKPASTEALLELLERI